MKLVSLNVWGGREFDPLIEFVGNQSKDTDVFCFQEVFDNSADKISDGEFRLNLLGELKKALPAFTAYYIPGQIGFAIDRTPVNYDLSFGTAIFAKEPLKPKFSHKELLKNDHPSSHPYHETKHLIISEFKVSGKPLTVATFHGLWVKDIGKIDIEERILQSKRVREFMDTQTGAKILTGDFNLNPDTKSLRILEDGYRNLIKEFSVPTTRSRLYKRQDLFADYTLVNEGIKIRSFKLPKIEISDHLPMILEFDLA